MKPDHSQTASRQPVARGSVAARFGTLMVLLALSCSSCSKTGPDALLSSARDYLAKDDHPAAIIQLKNFLQEAPDNPEARFLLATALSEVGDPVAAEVEYRKALDLGYQADRIAPPLAQTLLDQGQPKKIIEEFAPAASVDGALPELTAIVGEAHLALGQRDQARNLITLALTRSPQSTRIKLAAARLRIVDGDAKGALEMLDAPLASAPAPLPHYLLKGAILAATEQTAEAKETYEQAIAAYPKAAEPRSRLVSLLASDQQLEDAEKQFAELEKIAPKDLRTAYLKALLSTTRGRFAEARDPILRVLKVNPEHVPSQLLAGLVEYETGSYARAEDLLRKVVSRIPAQEYPRRLLVSSYLRSGQPHRAMEAFQPLLPKAFSDPGLAALAGEIHLAQGDIAKAAEYYEKAAELAPANTAVRARLGTIRVGTGDVDRAVRELEMVSAESKEQYQADLALITVRLQRRETDKALEAIATLERKLPKSPIVENLRGLAHLAKQDRKSARESFQKAQALQPTYFPAARNLAQMDLQDRKPDDAFKRFQTILDKEPNNEQALLAQARLLMRQKRTDEARKLIAKAIAAHPQSVGVRLALVDLYLRARDPKSALVAAQEAQAALPDDLRVLEVLGLAQQASGDVSQAIATFQRLAAIQPKSPGPQIRLAAASLAAKDPDGALRALRKALEIDPDQVQVQRDIAALYLATGRRDQAIAEAQDIQRRSPKHPVGYLIESDLLLARKDFKAAEPVLRRGIERTNSASLVVRLHATLVAQDRQDEAASLIDRWTRDNPNDVRVPLYLAEQDLVRGAFESSLRRYREITAKQPNNAMVLNNMAWVAARIKDPEALEYAEQAFDLAPDNPIVLDTYGTILVESGDTAQGVEVLSKAASLAPQMPGIRLNLAKALAKAGRKDEARKELDALGVLPEGSAMRKQADEIRESL